jgi:4-diphosphocytidyl-2-C-methyl-D-erythritol kinase
LRLIARANGHGLDDPRLAMAALAVGADVPVCLASRACIMRGVGDILSAPLDLPRLHAVLVNPGVAVATRDVFAKFAATQGSKHYLANIPRGHDAVIEFLRRHENNLTQAAIACAKVIADVLIALGALPAVRLVRMSGSGATCFALFATPGEAASAARRLQFDNKDWWVWSGAVGSAEK